MPENNDSASPQAGNGAEPGTGGVTPQAGTSAPTVNPQAGNSGSGNPQQPQMSHEDALEALRKERLALADARTKLKRLDELERAAQAAEEAKLSEQQKLERKLAEAQAAQAEQALSTQKRIVRAETKAVAVELGLNPELAARLVDFEAIKFNEDGDPLNLRELLEAAVKAYGLTPGSAGQQQKPATSGGATNPGRAAGTAQQIERRPLRGWDDVNWSR